MKTPLILLFFISILLVTAACDSGSSGPEPPSDPAELKSFHLAEVCTGTSVDVAAAYGASSNELHPIVLYSQNSFDGEVYDLMFPSQTDLPEDWTVAVDGDYSVVELVGCLARVQETLVETCEGYELDETDEQGTVELYDAVYELSIFAARTGELVGTETIETFMDECPSFVMFSTGTGEDLVEERYGQPDDELVNLVESYVNP